MLNWLPSAYSFECHPGCDSEHSCCDHCESHRDHAGSDKHVECVADPYCVLRVKFWVVRFLQAGHVVAGAELAIF